MKPIVSIALLLAIVSCSSIRTLEGRAKPVYITTAATLFGDTLYSIQSISYPILRELQGGINQRAELLQEGTTKVYIQQPTFFSKEKHREVLLYPGERIQLSGQAEDYTFSAINGTPQRNRELQVIKVFQQLEKHPPAVPRPFEYTLQTVLDFEKEQKAAIPIAEAASQVIFDSLLTAYAVSEKFKALTKDYVAHRYDFNLNWLYSLYKDTLAAYGLYVEKYRQLSYPFNSIMEKAKLNADVQYSLNDINAKLFPDNTMWSMADEAMFRACFDSIAYNFKGLARDYLLSRAMYRAYAKGIHVPRAYEAKYKQYSIDKAYRKIVNNTRKEQRRNKANTKTKPNRLLAASGETELLLENLLEQHKGKLIFIDLWASYCLPCIKEMPYLNNLKEKYPKDKVVFITISLNKEILSWKEAVYKNNNQTGNNFLLLDADKAAFCKQYDVSGIPRYLLIGKDGKVINADAPSPSDTALVVLLDKLLSDK